MKTRILMAVLVGVITIIPNAFGCSRDLTLLFWSPIIDRVSADCSFVGFAPNPSGIIFTGGIGIAALLVILWRRRK